VDVDVRCELCLAKFITKQHLLYTAVTPNPPVFFFFLLCFIIFSSRHFFPLCFISPQFCASLLFPLNNFFFPCFFAEPELFLGYILWDILYLLACFLLFAFWLCE